MTSNPLSDHEIRILGMMARGDTVKEIAEKLYIALPTARTHRHNIRKKMKSNNALRSFTESYRKRKQI